MASKLQSSKHLCFFNQRLQMSCLTILQKRYQREHKIMTIPGPSHEEHKPEIQLNIQLRKLHISKRIEVQDSATGDFTKIDLV